MTEKRYLAIEKSDYLKLKRMLNCNLMAGGSELKEFIRNLPEWSELPESAESTGRRGGLSRSDAKVKAARENAQTREQRGGRPRTLATIKDWTVADIEAALISDGWEAHCNRTTEAFKMLVKLIAKSRDAGETISWSKKQIVTDSFAASLKDPPKLLDLESWSRDKW